ncbi:MAG TPA: ScyD/ScyE family protein [Pyrinomonadaceae bacterium]|nr:ScyD/ScyE family protein [Pyrinomonadaceae bacterium]
MNKVLRLLAQAGFSLALAAAVTVFAVVGASAQQCPVTGFSSGLQLPSGVAQSPLGNLLVTENGTSAPNTGRVSIVEPGGTRRTLINGLPSGINDVGDISGPNGLLLAGRTLYVAIGSGDATVAGPIPGTELPNPQPSSPLYASILAIHFSANVEKTTDGLTLTPAHQQALAQGKKVKLGAGGDKVTVELVANFPDYAPDPLPFFADNVRHSNPYHMAAAGNLLYVTDAGMNSVRKVNLNTGAFSTLAAFAPIPNPLPFGPPVIEAVPTGIFLGGGQLLVTLFRGFPFPPGASTVVAVDVKKGTQAPFINGLSSAIDVLPVKSKGDTDYLVLELSTDLLSGQPGRLLRFETQGSAPTVIADCLVSPSAMTHNAKTRTLYVTEIFTGRVVTIPVE